MRLFVWTQLVTWTSRLRISAKRMFLMTFSDKIHNMEQATFCAFLSSWSWDLRGCFCGEQKGWNSFEIQCHFSTRRTHVFLDVMEKFFTTKSFGNFSVAHSVWFFLLSRPLIWFLLLWGGGEPMPPGRSPPPRRRGW